MTCTGTLVYWHQKTELLWIFSFTSRLYTNFGLGWNYCCEPEKKPTEKLNVIVLSKTKKT